MEKDGKMKKNKNQNSAPWNHMVMFDFDDTLAIDEASTLVKDKETGRVVDHLYGQEEFDNHVLDETKYFYDYSEFETVSPQATPIVNTVELMMEYLLEEDTKVIVLTARQDASRRAISNWLELQGIDTSRVSVYGSSGARLKADYLKDLLNDFSIKKTVTVYEDSENNIRDILELSYDFPHLKFEFIHVTDELEENREQKAPIGKYDTEKRQKRLNKLHPAMKRRLIGLGGNKHSTKGMEKVKIFKRSKSAPPME